MLAFVFCKHNDMSNQKNNQRTKHSKPKDLPSLKKLPAKKAASRAGKKDLVIDVKARKDYSSIIDLFKRKFTNTSKTKMPADLKPMLATLVDEPFSDDGWQFELKLDGYRTLAYLKSGKVDIRSRNNNSFNKKFLAIYD